MNNRILLGNSFFPGDLNAQVAAFVDHDNHLRYPESLNNLAPADAYFGRGQTFLPQRERLNRRTLESGQWHHRRAAA